MIRGAQPTSSGRSIAAVDHPVWGLHKSAIAQGFICVMGLTFIIGGNVSDTTARWVVAAMVASSVWMILHALFTAPSFRRPARFAGVLATMAVGCVVIPAVPAVLVMSVLGFPFWAVLALPFVDLFIICLYSHVVVDMLFPEGIPAEPID